MAKHALERATGGGAGPTPAEVHAALERILRSRCFEHAGRASDFLSYVVAKTLAGQSERLKGRAIAVHVFGRPRDFDARTDPLVRVEAVRLRQRLTEYYAGEGAAEPVTIEMPRGGYAVRATYARPEPKRGGATSSARRRRFGAAFGIRAALATATAIVLATLGAATLRGPTDTLDAPQAAAPNAAHRTTIFVVPLESLSARRELDRLAAALTEEIMLRLDDLDLYVIAMQPTWYRPSKALDGMLGAEHSYVFTGSVREHADGARITLRIIEAQTGAQIWTAGYDEPPGIAEDPERQAKLAREAAAAAALFGPVFDAELALARRATHTLELPDCQNRYRAFRRATDPALFPEAFTCFQSLVSRQPKLAHAWAGLAMLYIDEHVYYSGTVDGGAAFARARAALRTALDLDKNNLWANAALTRYQFYDGDPEFVQTAERTLALDPNNPEMLGLFGILLTAYGDVVHGLELVDRADQLSPQPRGVFNLARVFAHMRDGEPCAAFAQTKELNANKWFIAHMITASTAASCGDTAAAAEALDRLLALTPAFGEHAAGLIDVWRFDPHIRDAILSGLRKAGLELRE